MKRYVQLAVLLLLTVSALQTAYAQNDLTNKVMMGYQGWFNTPGDGSPVNEWRHWFKDQTPNDYIGGDAAADRGRKIGIYNRLGDCCYYFSCIGPFYW
jgi:hypothetical protein